jgi:hypothetical protein
MYKQRAFSNFNLDRNSDVAQKIENWRLSKQGDIAVNKQHDTRISYANMYVTMKSDNVDVFVNPLNGPNANVTSANVNQKSNNRIDEVKYDGSTVNTENPLYLIKSPAKTKTKTKTKRSVSPRSPDRI